MRRAWLLLMTVPLSLLGACAASPSPPEACRSDAMVAGLINLRDLGGLSVSAGTTRCGQLYRGAQLSALDSQGCADFARLGIKTIVDLRTEAERLAAPDVACANDGTELVLAPMPTPYSVSPSDYLADLHASASVASVFAALGDEARYPVYVHCVYGRDRTGVLAALVLLALGASREVVVADYQRSAEAGLATSPQSLAAVLDEVDAVGGVDTFLAGAGVSTEAIATLRARAITPATP